MSEYLFTSESVSEGHPDKVADQISDAILDAILAQDKRARVACETLVKTGVAVVAGEITTTAWADVEAIARRVITGIGYDNSAVGYDGNTCGVLNFIGKQSPHINQGVDRKDPEQQGAGDQGLMFGFACNETADLMPAPIYYAHRLVERQTDVRKQKNSPCPWLRPDAKSQVTLRYDGDRIVGIDAVVLSTQHAPEISQKKLKEGVMETVILPVLPKKWITKKTKFHINPTGKFEIGGPVGASVKSAIVTMPASSASANLSTCGSGRSARKSIQTLASTRIIDQCAFRLDCRATVSDREAAKHRVEHPAKRRVARRR